MHTRDEKQYKQLYEKYPLIFKKDGDSYTPAIGPMEGWLPLIDELCEKITNELMCLPLDEQKLFEVLQIKEKFGQLRFYFHIKDKYKNHLKWLQSYIHNLTTIYEIKAGYTCEVCGAPGCIREDKWVKALCDVHAEGRKPWKNND